MTRIAMLSMHTSPLARLGIGHGGGMNVYVRELAEALALQGVEVDIYTAATDGGTNVVDLRSRIHIRHIPMPLDTGLSMTQQALNFADLVERQISGPPTDGNITTNEVDAIHAHYWLSAVAGHQLKHSLNIPLVSTFHTLERVKNESGSGVNGIEREQGELTAISCSDMVIASNRGEVADIRRLYKQDANIKIVTPGVDTTVFSQLSDNTEGTPTKNSAIRRNLQLPLDSPIALFAGRIQYAKGLDRAVEALAQVLITHPNALLIIAGGPSGTDGENHLAAVKSQITKANMDANVRFVGPQSRANLAAYMQAADVCIVPSRTESFGLVALEAAACGTPVVASSVGGLQFIVEHGRTGFLAQDIDQFAGAIDHLFSNRAKAIQFGTYACTKAQPFTWKNSASKMADIYESIIRAKQSYAATCETG